MGYWEKKEGRRAYHHTAPISNVYALYEGFYCFFILITTGVRLILEEGLDKVQQRHKESGEALKKVLESRGFDS
jgi:alanine-glyoxylate transaminase/serine-glyoxylate transaminase/serine-pyruvate transaminase